jgi:hypothetical protein
MNSMHVQIQLGDSQNYAKLHLKKKIMQNCLRG